MYVYYIYIEIYRNIQKYPQKYSEKKQTEKPPTKFPIGRVPQVPSRMVIHGRCYGVPP